MVGELSSSIAWFSRDESSGKLSFLGAVEGGVRGTVSVIRQLRGLAIGRNDKQLFASSDIDFSLVVFNRDAATGAIQPVQCFQDDDAATYVVPVPPIPGAQIVDGLKIARQVVATSDGQSVYVAGYGDRGIAHFQQSGGRWQFVESFKEPPGRSEYGLTFASGLALNRQEKFLYVA